VADSQDLASRWSNLTRDEKRELVENITERIVVGDDDIQIEVFHLPFVGKTVAERQRGATGSSRTRRSPTRDRRGSRSRARPRSGAPRAAGAAPRALRRRTPGARRGKARRGARARPRPGGRAVRRRRARHPTPYGAARETAAR